jgi:hypothetical protein
MSSEKHQDRRPAIQSQRGRKRQKLGGTLQRIRSSAPIGTPWSDIRPPAARQPKGAYPSIPDTVVDHRPPVAQQPLSASAVTLLTFCYKLSVFVTATEEKAPVEWAGKHILGVRKARAYAILSEIGAHDDLESWLRQKVLAGMASGRIGRGRETRPSALAEAFFIALAGGELEARSCGRCLAGATRADLQAAACREHDEASSEVRDYMVHSGLLWRLRPHDG